MVGWPGLVASSAGVAVHALRLVPLQDTAAAHWLGKVLPNGPWRPAAKGRTCPGKLTHRSQAILLRPGRPNSGAGVKAVKDKQFFREGQRFNLKSEKSKKSLCQKERILN